MENNGIKPVSVKLIVTLNIAEYKEYMAKKHNVEPSQIEILFSDGEVTNEPLMNRKERKQATSGKIVGSSRKSANKFLRNKMDELKITNEKLAEMSGLSTNTIDRACSCFRLRKGSFDKIAETLNLTKDEIREFRKSLVKKQRNYR